MTGRAIVPDLVGMAYHDARDLASEIGVALASPDPDAPPIGAVAWPGLFFVTTQTPGPGAVLEVGESIKITVVKDSDGLAGVPRSPHPTPPHLFAHADDGQENEGHDPREP
jgi:beta-lactam-binding protein with PASTA domain